MSEGVLIALLSVAGAALTFLGVYIGHQRARPKTAAEARKLNAEAGRIEWEALRDEVARLTVQVAEQKGEIEKLKEEQIRRVSREDALEKENRSLKATVAKQAGEIKSLKSRLAAIEALFRVHPITPEMQAELDKLK